MDFYEPGDLAQIIARSAQKLNVDIDDGAAMEVARRARGTPRIANRLLKRVRDYAQVKTGGLTVRLPVVEEAMDKLHIDAQGLDRFDRKILTVIRDQYGGGPVGIEALAATLNEETDTIVDVVEPYLLKMGFLRRTSRGREITEKARKHL